MANLNELFPKNNWAADGALGGFLGGMQVPYALRQADNDEELSRLKQQQMRLANQFDEYDMPNKKAGSDTGVVEQLLKKKLIDSGVTEDSVRTKLEGDKLHNKSQVQKMDEETRNQRNQDITEMNAFFQKVPEGAQMTEPVQQRWKEWSTHMNTKYGMKMPDRMDMESKDILARYAAAAASSPQHTQKMEAQTQGEKSREKIAEGRNETAETVAETNATARLQSAQLAANMATSKFTDRAQVAKAQALARAEEAIMKNELAQVDASLEATKANNSSNPTESAANRAIVAAKKADVRARAMERIAAGYEAIAEGREPSPSRIVPEGEGKKGFANDQAKQISMMQDAKLYVPGEKPVDGQYYKNPKNPSETLVWDEEKKRMFVVKPEAEAKINWSK